MGFIRGSLGVFASVLLFIVFLIAGILLTLTFSLQYDNVHARLSPLIKDIVQEEMGINISEEVQAGLEIMKIQCETSGEDYNFNQQGYDFNITCEDLEQSTEQIVDSEIDNLIEQTYYKEYTCSFWSCFGEEEIPLFLVSKYAKDYWNNKFYVALTIAIVLMIALFFLFNKKHNTFVIPGVLLIVAALPFLKIGDFVSISGDRIVFEMLSIFFSKARAVFRIFFFTGIGLLIAGILYRLFVIGFKFSNFFNFSKFFNKEESKKDEQNKKTKEKKSKDKE